MTWIQAVACIEHLIEFDDVVAMSDSCRGELLRQLDERGYRLEHADRGVVCFSWDHKRLAIETDGKHAMIRKMEERDFEAILLNEALSE
jgi:hypothetical protein